MYLSIIIYVMFIFYLILIFSVGIRFIIFKKINAIKYLWNKNKILLLITFYIMNLPLQLTVLTLSLTSDSYQFIIGEGLSSENKIMLLLLVLTFIFFIFSTVYTILILDYLAMKFTNDFLYFLGKKIYLKNISKIAKNKTGYFIIYYYLDKKDKVLKKFNLVHKSLVGQFILNNYQELIVNNNKKIIVDDTI